MSAKERDLTRFNKISAVGLGVLLAVFAARRTDQEISNQNLEDTNSERVQIGLAVEAIDAVYGQITHEVVLESNELSGNLFNTLNAKHFKEASRKTGDSRKNESSKIQREQNAKALNRYQQELPQILTDMGENPSVFNLPTDIEDLKIYYPIYRAAQDKTGISWYVLWVVHQEESTVSRDPNAIDGFYEGSMQRNPKYHPGEIVDKISSDVAFLANLRQRYDTDWKEIRWAAQKIKEDEESTRSLLGALLRYSAEGPAYRRFNRITQLEPIFK